MSPINNNDNWMHLSHEYIVFHLYIASVSLNAVPRLIVPESDFSIFCFLFFVLLRYFHRAT